MKGGREGEREGEMGGTEGGRDGGRDGGREGRRDRGRERRREGEMEEALYMHCSTSTLDELDGNITFALCHTNNGFSLHVSSSRLKHLYCNNVFFYLYFCSLIICSNREGCHLCWEKRGERVRFLGASVSELHDPAYKNAVYIDDVEIRGNRILRAGSIRNCACVVY